MHNGAPPAEKKLQFREIFPLDDRTKCNFLHRENTGRSLNKYFDKKTPVSQAASGEVFPGRGENGRYQVRKRALHHFCPKPTGRGGILGPRGGHHQRTAIGDAVTKGGVFCSGSVLSG